MPSRYVGEMGVFLFAGVSERLELNNFVCVCVCVCVCRDGEIGGGSLFGGRVMIGSDSVSTCVGVVPIIWNCSCFLHS
jgi:hypothetical protein